MGGLFLKLKCRFCGFKSMPIRGDRCRRCNKQIPEAKKRPMATQLFSRARSNDESSGTFTVKESTLTKIFKKNEALIRKKREEALRSLQEEAEKSKEESSDDDVQELEGDNENETDILGTIDSLDFDRTFDYNDTSSPNWLLPDKFPLIELDDQELSEQVNDKEPALRDLSEESICLWRDRDSDMDDLLEGTLTGYFTLVSCNSVRIGSYKVLPEERVILSTIGIWICIPTIADFDQKITLTIDIFEIDKVLCHYMKPATIFVYVVPSAVRRIQELLDMDPNEGPFFDPRSSDETKKRITLLIKSPHVDTVKSIKDIFGSLDLLDELTEDENNDLLVRSSPTCAPYHSGWTSVFE